jgi:hypothetical protein
LVLRMRLSPTRKVPTPAQTDDVGMAADPAFPNDDTILRDKRCKSLGRGERDREGPKDRGC